MADERVDTAASPATAAPSYANGAESQAGTEASLLSVRIGPRHEHPALPEKPGDALIEAWARLRPKNANTVDTAAMRAELGPLWEACFWVEYCPQRERYVITPIAQMPPAVSACLKGPHDLAILVGWVNHIATRNCHSPDPVVSTTRLDFEGGLTDLDLTLAPADLTGGVVTRYLGALGL